MVRGFRSIGTSIAFFGLVSSLGLAGCGGSDTTLQDAVGYGERGPDEMAVIKRPPLVVPPDYNLRPPRPGDADDGSGAASDAARKTLIGPSSAVDDGPDEARAILTGNTPENGAATAGSEGQTLLVDRADRVVTDLDALTETRAENQVDRTLLRRLLAWTPEDRPAPAEGEGGDAVAEPAVVTVVSRSKTVLEPEGGSNP